MVVNDHIKIKIKIGSVRMYLDPAFGGMILQVILALVVVGGTMIFTMRRKIRSLFTKKKDEMYQNEPTVNGDESNDGVVDMLSDE